MHKPITTLRRALTNIKDKDKPKDRQGSSIQDQMLRLLGYLHWWNLLKPKHASDQTQTSDGRWWRQQSHSWTQFTEETWNRQGLWDRYYVFYTLQTTINAGLTLESWFTNLEQTVVFSLGQFWLGKAGKVWKWSENTSSCFVGFCRGSRVTWALGMVCF